MSILFFIFFQAQAAGREPLTQLLQVTRQARFIFVSGNDRFGQQIQKADRVSLVISFGVGQRHEPFPRLAVTTQYKQASVMGGVQRGVLADKHIGKRVYVSSFTSDAQRMNGGGNGLVVGGGRGICCLFIFFRQAAQRQGNGNLIDKLRIVGQTLCFLPQPRRNAICLGRFVDGCGGSCTDS